MLWILQDWIVITFINNTQLITLKNTSYILITEGKKFLGTGWMEIEFFKLTQVF